MADETISRARGNQGGLGLRTFRRHRAHMRVRREFPHQVRGRARGILRPVRACARGKPQFSEFIKRRSPGGFALQPGRMAGRGNG